MHYKLENDVVIGFSVKPNPGFVYLEADDSRVIDWQTTVNRKKQVDQIKAKAASDINAIASVDERIDMLAQILEIIEETVTIPPGRQGDVDALRAKRNAIKAIRDQAAQDIANL